MHKVHARISEKLNPIVDDSYFDVVSTAEDVGKTGDKIVKSLVNDGLQLMQAIVQIAHTLGLVPVAEGLESAAQAEAERLRARQEVLEQARAQLAGFGAGARTDRSHALRRSAHVRPRGRHEPARPRQHPHP